MFQPFICGASNHQEDDDNENWSSSSSSSDSTPRKSRRNSFSKRHNKDNKNPYSDRGRDKFSALLAELDEKRQKIYSQTDSEDISFVRFMYKDSTDCVPIVVKLKDKKSEEDKKKPVETKVHQLPAPGLQNIPGSEVLNIIKHPMETLTDGKEVNKKISKEKEAIEKTEKNNKMGFSWKKMDLHKWRRPSYYLPIFVLLILLLLVFFGRSVSILFTCIGWYIVPTIPGESSTKLTRSFKKQDYVRKLSENNHHHRKI